MSTLTSTSYAVLGLIAARPCSTYEIAAQVERTLNRFWPRTRSKVYEEPKKLVAHGYATATAETIGRRPRTVYTITPSGRRALAAWVAAPAEGPALEFEQLLKVFYADSGTTQDVRRHLAALRAWAHERTLENVRVGQSYLEGHGEFPQRSAVNQLVGRFLDDFLQTLDDWALWADRMVVGWPESPSSAVPDLAEMERTVARSRTRAARYAR